jgi:CHAT domain-containing protein/Flp pilus assembly protein TadD
MGLMDAPEESQAQKYLNSGQQCLEFGNYSIAIHYFEQAITLNPELAEAWEGKAATLRKLGRHEEAIAASEKAIALRMNVVGNNAEFWFEQGNTQLFTGNFEGALTSFKKAIEFNPNFYEAWMNHGAALSELGLHKDAIASFDKVVEIQPDFHNAWSNRGLMLIHLEHYEDAIISFDNAVEIQPDCHEAWFDRGNALASLQRYEEAIASFDHAVKIQPEFHEAWSNRGISLISLAHYSEAISSFDNAIKLEPDNAIAWHGRGKALIEINGDVILNCDQGIASSKKKTEPESWGELHHLKGKIYYYQAKLSPNISASRLEHLQALECYEQALKTLEIFPVAYLGLIQSLIKSNICLDNSDAVSQWRIKGLEVFRQLLNVQPSLQKKRKLEVEFSSFSQVAVDALVSAGNLTVALEAAERYKNRCLTWILDEWQEQVTSPSCAEIRQLLSSNHEIIYWHLSRETLTTFILTSHQKKPIVLTQKSTYFETWQKDWDKRYGDYRSKGKDQVHHLASHPWRNTLETELDRLKAILDIEKIEAHLSPNTQLILIPHRDLHRFPIHALFNDDRITTYLPSIQVGLAQKPPSTSPTHFLLNVEDPARPDQPPLQFAQLESAVIQAMFAPNVKAIDSDNGDRATVETALQEHRGIFHFTGHGDYNARQPEHSAIGLTDTDRLTAKEISALNLQQYKLVCLSACETALTGRQTIDTEYVGLTSAFLQSGVSQVVSTLWTVQEVSNAYLMIRFYQFLQNGISPAEALKRSQSWLRTVTRLELADWLIETSRLKSLDSLIKQELEQQACSLREEANASTIDLHHPPYADPYHWAAFTLTGRGFL